MAAIDYWTSNISGEGRPVAVHGLRVSPAFFSILRVTPLIGHDFAADEETPGRATTVIFSYSFWQSRYAADRGIIGRKVMMNGEPATVAGVLPADFRLPGSKPDVFAPFPIDRREDRQSGRYLSIIARLKPGVSVRQAQEEMTAITAQLAREYPAMDKGWSAAVVPFLTDTTENIRTPLLVVLAAVGLVLLIAC